MSVARKSAFSVKILDLPLLVAALLTVLYYLFVTHESMKDTTLYRYTTEHSVEYVIVAFFIWGLTDAAFRALAFPRELLALRQRWLPPRTAREPVSNAAAIYGHLQKKPRWFQESRLGQRLMAALAHLIEKESADEFSDYLRNLSDQDYEKTTTNYGLIRFICWVTPMFGFLGTVVHFGTALGGQSAGEIGDKLPTVVAEMGTAFNTTTVALIAATTMMFCLFLCERTEKGIVHAIDQRTERDLLNRFEVADANMTPFLNALHSSSQASLQAMDTTIARQLEIWSGALHSLQRQTERQQQWQSQVWVEILEKLDQRFEANDAQREKRLLRLLDAMEDSREKHRAEIKTTIDRVASLQADFARFVEALSGIAQGDGELVRLQSTLADNLHVLRETQQIDQALHGLTAAIHLLTARNSPAGIKEHRAA
ncbi:MAG: MotA/TolQ/ExbB proton channel family protein [Planctomycetia bacterium]|nr:MotA/TolQ/ExbB proton channel family protein [Planctomycetia bacterium]